MMSFERWQILGEVAALIVLSVVSLHLFSAGDAMSVTSSLAVAYAVPRVVYTSRRWSSHAGRLVLLALGLLMVALAVLTIWNITVNLGLPLSAPHLESDDSGYYRWALHYYNGSVPAPNIAFFGFPLLMLMTWKVLGVSVAWPLAMNVMLTLLTVVFTAALTRRLLHGKVECSDRWLATMGLCLASTLMYFVSQGLRVQKESMVYLAMMLVGYVLAGIKRDDPSWKRAMWKDIALWTIGCVMLSLGRTTYLYFVMIGLAIMALAKHRYAARKVLVLALIVAAAFVAGNLMARYSVDGHMGIIKGGYVMQKQFMGGGVQQPYIDLVGKYFYYPVWQRLLILPLACCVQFIIPFPWVYDNPTILSLLPRMAWGWYAVGGITLFYFFFMSWRRGMNMGAWAWWPASVFVIIAYVVAGTVSRYILPVEPLAVPIAVFVVAMLRQGRMRRQFMWWSVAYVVVLAVTLVLCYHIQLSYLENLDSYYKSLLQS